MAASAPTHEIHPFLAEYCGEGDVTAGGLLACIEAAEEVVTQYGDPSSPALDQATMRMAEIRKRLDEPGNMLGMLGFLSDQLDFQLKHNLCIPMELHKAETTKEQF